MKTRAQIIALATAEGGLPIWGCLPGSPAAEAGIRYGDILLTVNGQRVAKLGEYLEIRRESQGPLSLEIRRDADVFTIEILPRSSSMTPNEIATHLVASQTLGPIGSVGDSGPN